MYPSNIFCYIIICCCLLSCGKLKENKKFSLFLQRKLLVYHQLVNQDSVTIDSISYSLPFFSNLEITRYELPVFKRSCVIMYAPQNRDTFLLTDLDWSWQIYLDSTHKKDTIHTELANYFSRNQIKIASSHQLDSLLQISCSALIPLLNDFIPYDSAGIYHSNIPMSPNGRALKERHIWKKLRNLIANCANKNNNSYIFQVYLNGVDTYRYYKNYLVLLKVNTQNCNDFSLILIKDDQDNAVGEFNLNTAIAMRNMVYYPYEPDTNIYKSCK